MGESVVARAERLADEALFPEAAAVDRADRVPERQLRLLDEAGLTGLAATDPDLDTRVRVTAALAGGSLATAFVWLQHQGALAAVTRSPLAGRFAGPLASGALRAGVAITALRPPAPLAIRRSGHGLELTGTVPWVTGWGIVDLIRVAALDDSGVVHTALLDASAAPTLRAEPRPLAAANASRTVALTFAAHPVPEDRLLGAVPLDQWQAADAAGLAGNGALPLGVAGRAARLAESVALSDAVEATRDRLVTAEDLPAARAACAALAVTAASALTVAAGSRSVLAGSDPARLAREAQFLLAFGSRPAIRTALLATFS